MTSQVAFQEAYKKLNSEQKEAVDTIEGPVMVIAGPGTGKTQILALRIANIRRLTDTPPDAILALTFTESGVVSMRRRLASLMGAEAYRIKVSTFHGFANDIIKTYPEKFPAIIGATPITELDQVKILRGIIDSEQYEHIKPFGDRYFYLRSLLRAIGELKREGVKPKTFTDLIATEAVEFEQIPDLIYEKGAHKGKMKGCYRDVLKHIERNKEVALVYEGYQQRLREGKWYDFSDMIIEVVDALEGDEDLLLTLQEKYLYFLADEHQDSNRAQNRMLELLAGYFDTPNLFIVGDEKQAIFRFQGASLENFLYFKDRFPSVKLITLKENYRSSQSILDAAHDIAPSPQPLRANAGHTVVPIQIHEFPSEESELFGVAQEIKKAVDEGIAPEEVAVLFRQNRDAHPIAFALERADVPFHIESDQDVLADEHIRKLLVLLKAVERFGSDAELAVALHCDCWGIDPLDVYKVMRYAAHERAKLYDVIRSEQVLTRANVQNPHALCEAYENMSRWARRAHNGSAAEAFEDIVSSSGLLAQMLADSSPAEKMVKLHAFYDEIKNQMSLNHGFTLKDFLEQLALIQEHGILLKSGGGAVVVPGRVRLMTAHKSKGLEFERVFIIKAVNGHWGSRSKREHIKLPLAVFKQTAHAEAIIAQETDADERNLFFVALTRAKKGADIFYAVKDGAGREQLPSQFLGEIREELKELVDDREQSAEWERRRSEGADMGGRAKEVRVDEMRDFFSALFEEQGLSVTALNNYLECPWQYFYRNLVRIPEAPNKHLAYGTAVHAALHAALEKVRQGVEPDEEFVLREFEYALGKQPITQNEYEETLTKGKIALSGYVTKYGKEWTKNTLVEFDIRGLSVEGVSINGKIDKIEILEGSKVNVVDYKTGKPKSRNAIEGATKSSEGNYKRQLVFYKLLLDRFADGKYEMVSGEIDFVDPNEKGEYKKEKFDIMPEELTTLTQQIKEAAQDIRELGFWNRTCGDHECQYCKLRTMIGEVQK